MAVAPLAPTINGGTDTVNYTNVMAGQSDILPGAGPLTVNQKNVTLGFDLIHGTGGVGGTSTETSNGTYPGCALPLTAPGSDKLA